MDQDPLFIRIRGARVHNLQNVDLDLPRSRLVTITGPSGSGKSSLAFDTLYAEGQRRYVESLSSYARQFLRQMAKPDADSIDGLSPAISIEQKTVSHNPRSTVGTVTEIQDYLRLLFARVGKPHCPSCGRPISSQTVQEMVDAILQMPKGSRIGILAPVVRERKGEHSQLLDDLRKSGYTRINVDGELMDLQDPIQLDSRRKHSIDVYVDRIVMKKGIRQRLTDSVEISLRLARGLVKIAPVEGDDRIFSERHACVTCGISLPEISPRLFSFNSPQGACPECDGLGNIHLVDPRLVVPDGSLSLRQGAIAAWGEKNTGYYWQTLEAVARHFGIDLDKPFEKLPPDFQDLILNGTGDEKVRVEFVSANMSHEFQRPFEGVVNNLARRYRETQSDAMRADIEQFMSSSPCPVCKGRRLRPEALAVRVGGKNIAQVTGLSVVQCLKFFENLPVEKQLAPVANRIQREIKARLKFMADVGLDYLTLDRSASSLSGGEAQRIRLATQIGSNLVGVLYVIDEPTIGLHPRDCQRLLGTLKQMRDRGNTVLVVEHDPATIMASDHVVDMGPGAGRNGGKIMAQGNPKEILHHPKSITGAFLSGQQFVPIPKRRRSGRGKIVLKGARGNNLKNLRVPFKLGVLTCVTGVSGSGKSTLVIDTLYRGLANHFFGSKISAATFDGFEGLEQLDKVIHIDQSPIGRTPRSNPATYTGLFTSIRNLFAALPESRVRGYKPGRFSFNAKGGRCESCGGCGQIRIEMHFLPDVYVTCEACQGKRFNRETLEVEFRGYNIHQVLEMTVDEALEFFAHHAGIGKKLQTLSDVGLGYIQLGQAATTLSGGEAQRVKLSKELARKATGKTLYILDEPTTGLHMSDVRQLLVVLQRLVDAGNTVIVIEHNLDVIKSADWIIDLGPEGGDRGGKVVAQGTPEKLSTVVKSHTGKFLKELLANNQYIFSNNREDA